MSDTALSHKVAHMAAIRFRFRNRPAISAGEARAVIALLKAKGTTRAGKLADKILNQVESTDRLIADLVLIRAEMLELLTTLNDHARDRRFDNDATYRLRAELEGAINRD